MDASAFVITSKVNVNVCVEMGSDLDLSGLEDLKSKAFCLDLCSNTHLMCDFSRVMYWCQFAVSGRSDLDFLQVND